MRRWALLAGLTVIAAAPASAQNTVRWNDVVRSLDELGSEPPAVRLWLDKRMVMWGEGIRVGYRVDEDAFVVVARVDGEGRLTILHPSGRNRVTEVRGGADNYVRSARLGSFASFVPGDRPGNTGYVFALASRSPMDLSRLRYNDFSAWVTGVPRSQPASRYFGDPYRVVQRFARLVSYSEHTEFDWDFEYYSVDYPSFVTAASSFCGYFGSRGRLGSSFGMAGYEYDPFYSNLGSCQSYYNCLMPSIGGMWWNGIPWFYGWGGWSGGGYGCGTLGATQVASNPVPTTPPPPLDSPPVNPWVPGAIDRPNVDKSAGEGNANGPHIMTEMPAPTPGTWNDRDDLSFSIPSRALRGLRGASRSDGSVPLNGAGSGTSGPMPMPSRPAIEMANEPQIEWVRPPRSFDAPPRDPVDRLPSLGGRRSAFGRSEQAPPSRDFGPPPRMGSPMFDREPGRNSAFDPIRTFSGATHNGGGSMYSPPSFGNEGRPATNPGISTGSGVYAPGSLSTGGSSSAGTTGSGSGTSSPPATGSASGTSGGSSSTGSERKPHQK